MAAGQTTLTEMRKTASSIASGESSASHSPSASEPASGGYRGARRPRCARCGEALGIYEPLVVIDAQGARRTSCAADPQLLCGGAELLHRACHASGPPAQHPLAASD
jgi:hypothetical protein